MSDPANELELVEKALKDGLGVSNGMDAKLIASGERWLATGLRLKVFEEKPLPISKMEAM